MTTSAAPTTSAGPDFPAGLPEAAKKKTKAGAKAFVEHFVSELNKAWRLAEPERIARLCRSATSKSCTALIKTATDLRAKNQHYDADPLSIERIVPLGEANGLTRLDFRGHQELASVVDRSGNVVLTDSREPSHFMFFLEWTGAGWHVNNLKPVST